MMMVERKMPKPVASDRLVIGIDPDLVKSGVASVERGELKFLWALRFPQLLEYARHRIAEGALFVVEDVEHDKTTYHRGGTNNRQHAKISQNVGQVKGVARVLVECLIDMGADVVQVKPLKGTVKRAKDDKVFFNQLTGWSGNSNEDKRDAALLALFAVPRSSAIRGVEQ
jgi:hypothetical protein